MNTVTIEVIEQPSHSKGWSRYSLTDPSTDTPVQTARTGNRWMSADMRPVEVHGPLLLTMQVMLRVGKGRTERQEITSTKTALVAMVGHSVDVTLKPGSQGLTVRVHGACLAVVMPLPTGAL